MNQSGSSAAAGSGQFRCARLFVAAELLVYGGGGGGCGCGGSPQQRGFAPTAAADRKVNFLFGRQNAKCRSCDCNNSLLRQQKRQTATQSVGRSWRDNFSRHKFGRV